MNLAQLTTAVVAKTGRPQDEVESVLLLNGVPEHPVHSRRRHLQLQRMRVRGQKNLARGPEAFDRTYLLNSGLTVITGHNLRGKTTILELFTLMLRGSARDLQPDVLRWLTSISLDVVVNDNPLGFRLQLEDGSITAGWILEGDQEALAAADDDPGDTAIIERAGSDADWQRVVEGQLLDRLGFEPLRTYVRVGGREVGNVQSHGWPAYYSAVYPPSGADTTLLGSEAGSGLSSRLLDVFLDLPGAVLRARLSAAKQVLKAQDDARRTQAGAFSRALADRTVAAKAALESARADLAAIESGTSEIDAARQELMAARVAHDRASVRELEIAKELASASSARIADRRALNALNEDEAAGALFHGLDPTACPRCENQIDDERRRLEVVSHACAVCARPVLHDEQAETVLERRQETERAAQASERAERLLQNASDAAAEKTSQAIQVVRLAERAVEQAASAPGDVEAQEARRAVAAAEGAVVALESVQPVALENDVTLIVLEAAQAILTEELTGAASGLLSELSIDIADLGRAFEIANLESVSLKRNLHMPVTKGGGSPAPFGRQSAGERLRLRYALLIALLRIGRRRSIASHPGLLLLDSIRAEEVQDEDAGQLLAALADVCREEPSLQIFVTTQDASLPSRVSPPAQTITTREGESALF